MIVHQHIDSFRAVNPVVTIGTFDGVHRGHKLVIEQLNRFAHEAHGESVLFSFYPHPRLVLFPNESNLRLITTLNEKIALLEEAGVDHLVIYPFDKHFASLTYVEFIEQILLSKLKMHTLVVGHDHKLGRNREGTFENIKLYSEGKGFGVKRIDSYTFEGNGVSSSKIRAALSEGNLRVANQYLGYNFSIRGKVTQGNKLGRSLGFPTANIVADDVHKLIPKTGVYAITARVNQTLYKGMLNIGFRPTVSTNADHRTIEAHLLNFKDDIYNQNILISLHARVRDEKKFSSVEQLKQQLEKDEQVVRSILK